MSAGVACVDWSVTTLDAVRGFVVRRWGQGEISQGVADGCGEVVLGQHDQDRRCGGSNDGPAGSPRYLPSRGEPCRWSETSPVAAITTAVPDAVCVGITEPNGK